MVGSSLSLPVIRCHSVSFVVTHSTTRCHSLYHSLSFVVTICHSSSLVILLVVACCHLLSLDVPLVCLFTNDLFLMVSINLALLKRQLNKKIKERWFSHCWEAFKMTKKSIYTILLKAEMLFNLQRKKISAA